MTKAKFRKWLQSKVDDSHKRGCQFDHGDVWRSIDSKEIRLPKGVQVGMDFSAQDIIFKCKDGLLATGFETGCEGETEWFFADDLVENNLRDYSVKELSQAVRCTINVASDLLALGE